MKMILRTAESATKMIVFTPETFERYLRRAYTDSATCLQLVHELKKTEIAERLQRSRKGFLEVANQSPIEISR